jgi:hypothetical protein
MTPQELVTMLQSVRGQNPSMFPVEPSAPGLPPEIQDKTAGIPQASTINPPPRMPQVGPMPPPMPAPTQQPTPQVDPRTAQIAQLQTILNQRMNQQQPWWQSGLQGMMFGAGGSNPQQASLMAQQGMAGLASDREREIQNRVAQIKAIQQQQEKEEHDAFEQRRLEQQAKRDEDTLAETKRLRTVQENTLDFNKKKAASAENLGLMKAGYRYKTDPLTQQPTGEIEEIPYAELSAPMQAVVDSRKAMTALRETQEKLDEARTNYTKTLTSNNKDRIAIAYANLRAREQDLKIKQNEFAAKWLGQDPTGKTLPGLKVDEGGKPIAPGVSGPTGGTDKPDPNATQQLKNQASAAITTKEKIKTVRDMIAKKPYLIGPAVGRLQQVAQGIGTSFGMQNPQDEKDAAELASQITYLFTNELKAAFPNRPNKEIIEELRKASAQISQNPNILEGMLRSAADNADTTLGTAAKFGIKQAKDAMGPQVATPKPGAQPKIGDEKKYPNGNIGVWDGKGYVLKAKPQGQ